MRDNIASRRSWLHVALYFICLLMSGAPLLAADGENSRGGLHLGGQPRFLPVDKAFRLSASWEGGKISVRWYLMPGYYLYRHRLGFASPDATLGKPEIPQGETEQDPYFGKVQIYRDELLVDIPVSDGGHSVSLEVRYQGCADAGYCYPPQKRLLKVTKLQ